MTPPDLNLQRIVDELANALQAAVLIAEHLQLTSAATAFASSATAQDAIALSRNLKRATDAIQRLRADRSGEVRVAIYARVSTVDQEPENQLQELRRYIQARGWTGQDYVDRGVSGAKDRRPAIDQLLTDAKRRRFDVVVCWRLDRFGRNLRHLVTLIDELTALGIGFASLGEGIDTQTRSGRLQLHILAALAKFERARIQERVRAGLARVRGAGCQAWPTETPDRPGTARCGRRIARAGGCTTPRYPSVHFPTSDGPKTR
jgi:hypothetical protein